MASKVAIANLALQRLGERRITSMTQDTPGARSMNALFDHARDDLLRRYVWSFAIARASIAADAEDTLWGALNRYALPADFLRLLRDDESGSRLDWKIEGRFIVTKDGAPLRIRYVRRVENTEEFDVSFVQTLAGRLAVLACEEITGSTAKLQALELRLRDDFAAARQANAYELDAVVPLDDEWLDSVL